MRKSVQILLAAMLPPLMGLLVSCNNEDEPTPGPTSLICSYIEPTSVEVSIYTQDKQTGDNWYLGPSIFFTGTLITPESSPVKFKEITKFFGDTAFSKSTAQGFWPDHKRDGYLSKPLLSLKLIAADDSWGSKIPKGTDVSNKFRCNYVSAQKYIDSKYQDSKMITSKGEGIQYLSDWKPEYGYSLHNNLWFVGPSSKVASDISRETGEIHDVATCKGHKYIIIAIFPDDTITSQVYTAWCPWKAA